jgi:Tfp pilus assembly protein PilX
VRTLRRRAGGFILLVVLALLVVLTLVAALVYSRASDQVVVSQALRRQNIAQDRALAAMRRGIINISQINSIPGMAAGLTAFKATAGNSNGCPLQDPVNCGFFFTSNVVVGPPNTELEKGGGDQYRIDYIYWLPPSANTQTAPLYVIHAYGYDGYSGSKAYYQSEVVAEVMAGEGKSQPCFGYCGGGL